MTEKSKTAKTQKKTTKRIVSKGGKIIKPAFSAAKVKFLDRELSWLAFNARVLQEASDSKVPLLERVKFLGIFSNNLDEFFRVRVASIRRLLKIKKAAGLKEAQVLKTELEAIRTTVLEQQEEFQRIYSKELIPAMASKGIVIVNENQLTDEEEESVREYFISEVSGRLNPLMLQHGKDIPMLKDGAIYLAVKMQNKASSSIQFALVLIPARQLGRFYILPKSNEKSTRIILLDDIIRLCLPQLFSSLDFDTFQANTIKITRDAELDLDNEVAMPLLEKVEKSLKQRKTGVPTRFIYDEEIPRDLLEFLKRKLKIDKDGSIPGGRYHNFRDFIGFPKVGDADLRYNKPEPARIAEIDKAKSMLNVISRHDVLLSYPYQSFDYVIRLLREAAIDPSVFAIRISLYRLAENSSIAEALINAVQNGKQVTVVMELRARFMEEHNIYWANRLKEGGANVIYGIPDFKVHSKLIVVSRRVGFQTEHIVHIGTGNFNEDTARLYCDHSFLTSKKRIAAECLKVFEMIQNFKPEKFTFQTLWVSPVNTRTRFIALLNREIKNAVKGKPARAIIKVNSLVDDVCMEAILKAAHKGVKIDLIIRGICCLPLNNTHQNIRAVSIIDKYLEHARIFYFENSGEPEVFIGSADLMQRNLQARVEVTVPVADKNLKRQLIQVLETQLADNVKARILDSKMQNQLKKPETNEPSIRAQLLLHSQFATSL